MLQRQAEMLVALSAISHLPGVSRRHIISATSQNANCPSQKSRSQKLPLRGLGIAVAAFIAVFVFQTSWSSTTPPQESESPNNDYFAGQAIDHDSNMLTVSESALIARAWAAAQVDSEDTTSTPYASLGGTYVQSIDSSNDELKLDIEATENTSDDSFS